MIFFVLGYPGDFAEWCGTATTHLARAAGQGSSLIAADTLDEIAFNAVATGSPQMVVLSRRPGGRLRTALRDTGQHFVLALDDLRTLLLDLVITNKMPLTEAVRALANSGAAIDRCAELPGALLVRPAPDGSTDETVAQSICHHLQIPFDSITGAELPEYPSRGRVLPDFAEWWSGLTPAERDMVVGALRAYFDRDDAGRETAITWSGDLFFACDRPDQPASMPIDITGRARRLVEGPHITLAPGSWSLNLSLWCSGEVAEHEFRIELSAGEPLALGSLHPVHEGNEAIRLDFVIGELVESPVSISISTTRAAFDGTISVQAAAIARPAA